MSPSSAMLSSVLIAATAMHMVAAVNLTFANCLSSTSATDTRFLPTQVEADYNITAKRLTFYVHGNMTGYVNDTSADGTLASALVNTVFIAGYTQTKMETRLCNVTYLPYTNYQQHVCPFGPGPVSLKFETELPNAYTFSTLTNNMRINAPKGSNYSVGCFNVQFTPPLRKTISNVITYVTLAVLILVGIRVVLVALFNPWSGTLDPYRALSNFGAEDNALRLLTPGFSDCLSYIQFAAYSSMLALNYPGFYQQITSRISWSLLLFSSSPVSKALGYTPQDGISIATYINFVGARRQDAWKSFMIWWIIIQACVIAMVCLLLFAWWVVTPSSFDLTRKNIPFIGGATLRVYYWFLSPLALFTSYQLYSAQSSAAGLVAGSALVLMFLVILVPVTLIWYVMRYRPRQDLHDDLTLLSLFGPLYNAYADIALSFFVPVVVLAIMRGLVVGLLSTSGTAQLVCMIVLESISLALTAYLRPWPTRTNTTALALVVCSARLVILFFMIAFVNGLAVQSSTREWLGYIILIIHGIVLVFVFLGNALLSMLELALRTFVMVPQDEGARAIFGARQLRSRRRKYEKPTEQPDESAATRSLNQLIVEGKDSVNSPFYRRPRASSRLHSRMESLEEDEQSLADGHSGFMSPTSFVRPPSSAQTKRTYSYGSEEMLSSLDPGTITSRAALLDQASRSGSFHDANAGYTPTEEAAKRGVDYAVREADVYHPQSTGELLGPSKKLGTGPADPNGPKFRKFNLRPWKRNPNPEKGKFIVVRSVPQQQVPMRELNRASTSISIQRPSHDDLSRHIDDIPEEELALPPPRVEGFASSGEDSESTSSPLGRAYHETGASALPQLQGAFVPRLSIERTPSTSPEPEEPFASAVSVPASPNSHQLPFFSPLSSPGAAAPRPWSSNSLSSRYSSLAVSTNPGSRGIQNISQPGSRVVSGSARPSATADPNGGMVDSTTTLSPPASILRPELGDRNLSSTSIRNVRDSYRASNVPQSAGLAAELVNLDSDD
ncbi:hypothetical protein PYCC9005_002495 [Savitreella phatthalungensis]